MIHRTKRLTGLNRAVASPRIAPANFGKGSGATTSAGCSSTSCARSSPPWERRIATVEVSASLAPTSGIFAT